MKNSSGFENSKYVYSDPKKLFVNYKEKYPPSAILWDELVKGMSDNSPKEVDRFISQFSFETDERSMPKDLCEEDLKNLLRGYLLADAYVNSYCVEQETRYKLVKQYVAFIKKYRKHLNLIEILESDEMCLSEEKIKAILEVLSDEQVDMPPSTLIFLAPKRDKSFPSEKIVEEFLNYPYWEDCSEDSSIVNPILKTIVQKMSVLSLKKFTKYLRFLTKNTWLNSFLSQEKLKDACIQGVVEYLST